MYDVEKIKDDLTKILSPFRYDHSLRVATEASLLARQYCYDEEKAYLTGLTHDIAREFSESENREWIQKYHLEKEISFLREEIIHALIGSYVVREYYHFSDEMSEAIKYHTIGHFPMSLLSKIIFVADKIGRRNVSASIEEIRKKAYQNLDDAILLCLEYQKEKLEKQKGIELHPDTVVLLKALREKKGEPL